jgi:hypothetical protein
MKKILIITLFFTFLSLIIFQAFGHNPGEKEDKHENLKVLPKHISNDSLHNLMKFYSRSLGVKCGFCHAQKKDDPKHLNFASDEKHEKEIARDMIKMTAKINKKYIHKIAGGSLEPISCVTCHMGRTTPIISTDSLSRK